MVLCLLMNFKADVEVIYFVEVMFEVALLFGIVSLVTFDSYCSYIMGFWSFGFDCLGLCTLLDEVVPALHVLSGAGLNR